MKIKYVYITVLFFVNTITTQSNFEGIIKYKLSFQDKSGEMTDEESTHAPT